MTTVKKISRIILIIVFSIFSIINLLMVSTYWDVITGSYQFIENLNIDPQAKIEIINSWSPLNGVIGMLIIIVTVIITVQLIRKKKSAFIMILIYSLLDLFQIYSRGISFTTENTMPIILMIGISGLFYILFYKEWDVI